MGQCWLGKTKGQPETLSKSCYEIKKTKKFNGRLTD